VPLPKLENDDAAVRSLKEYRNALKALGGLGGLAVGAASAQNEEDPTSRGLGLQFEGYGLDQPTAEAIYEACARGDAAALRAAFNPLLGEEDFPAPPPAPEEDLTPRGKGAKSKGGGKGGKKQEEEEPPPPEPVSLPAGSWKMVDAFGLPPLAHVASGGDVDLARLLLRGGSSVDTAGRTCGRTPLHFAAASQHVDMCVLLLDVGAEVLAQTAEGLTALHISCEAGDAGAAQALLDRGAQTEVVDYAGRTSLMAAAAEGHDEVVDLLVDAGADLGARDNNGWSALHHACGGKHTEAALALVEAGASVGVVSKGGRSLRHLDSDLAEECEEAAAAYRERKAAEAAAAEAAAEAEMQELEVKPAKGKKK